jgi:soluble lytic murein transglycosylase-like protein
MSGLGAWSKGAVSRASDPTDERVEAQIHAIKVEMIYRGLGRGVDVNAPAYGKAIEARVTEFQTASHLTPSGKVGATTASYIFWTRCVREQIHNGIPGRLLWKMIMQESAFDPAAQGYFDPRDEGGAQIHMPYHPEITVEQAWTPTFFIPWLAGNLVEVAAALGDWDGAVAAHNVGTRTAELWVQAGKPASGNVHDGIDWFARATQYVHDVKAHRTPA